MEVDFDFDFDLESIILETGLELETESNVLETENSINNSGVNLLEEIGQKVYEKALKYCPYETGNLRSSGYIVKSPTLVTVGFESSYAPFVHECMYIAHKSPTRAKFLTDALTEVLTELVIEKGVDAVGELVVNFKMNREYGIKMDIAYKNIIGVDWQHFIGYMK